MGTPARSGAILGHRGAHVGRLGGFVSDKIPQTPPAGGLDALKGLVGTLCRRTPILRRSAMDGQRPKWGRCGASGGGEIRKMQGPGRGRPANGSFFRCWDLRGLRGESGGAN